MVIAIDPSEGLCKALLAEHDEAGARLHALIDLANLPLEAKELQRSFRNFDACCVFGEGALPTQLATPWLLSVELSPARHGVLRMSTELALRSSAVSWLRSSLSTADLALRLRLRTQARLPGRYDVLLRHFDPRVLPVLHELLTPEQRETFFALGSRWHYLDRQSSLSGIALSTAPAIDAFTAPLELDERQAGALLDAAEIDAVMPELVREEPERFLALGDGSHRYRFTRHWLERAQHWKLLQFPQKVVFCALALRLGERFDEQPPWPDSLERVAAGRMTLAAAIAQASTG